MRERVRGVALIITNPSDEILILQELVDKPHFGKCAGMFSVPMETSKPKETDFCALRRLCEEELPGIPSLELPGKHIGVYRIVAGVWVTLYSTTSVTHILPVALCAHSDVGNYRWMSPRDSLRLWLRQGAFEMVSDYVAGNRGVLCRACRRPRKTEQR